MLMLMKTNDQTTAMIAVRRWADDPDRGADHGDADDQVEEHADGV